MIFVLWWLFLFLPIRFEEENIEKMYPHHEVNMTEDKEKSLFYISWSKEEHEQNQAVYSCKDEKQIGKKED